ncbi:Na+/H+ antiporter subunit G [Pseudorhodobacter sp. E13]|uniref:Na+/H+ antiporter subunit G n=1 Tax=Pseudorhodobacter sp. E13 TaxID=2487931 RepID=UPI000F8F03FC|nr:Na+/H+ antiporter subunit G [Pseudorhodobacter sp. E13]RUS58998.1 Na+/H+ antiporter subunit G [Pseudorhodobacter sp. E13]
MEQIAEIVISLLLVAAGIFGLVGSYGLLKLPDTMSRLHAPTKATTLGVGGVLIASMLYFWIFRDTLSWHELLITMFLLLTAPITANFIAKAHLHRFGNADDLPDTQTDHIWATFEDEAEELQPVMTRTTPKPAPPKADH